MEFKNVLYDYVLYKEKQRETKAKLKSLKKLKFSEVYSTKSKNNLIYLFKSEEGKYLSFADLKEYDTQKFNIQKISTKKALTGRKLIKLANKKTACKNINQFTEVSLELN